ncbi:MAG: hypothetical protein NTU61_00045 [Candidatus Altiarchaeota archaeon]|nr:hypothetical protein [Candidatus Altiarchaeota archaeon]
MRKLLLLFAVTLLVQQAMASDAVCVDYDNGIDVYNSSFIYGTDSRDSQYLWRDFCIDSTHLGEYWCDSGIPQITELPCTLLCSAGACMTTTTSTTTSTSTTSTTTSMTFTTSSTTSTTVRQTTTTLTPSTTITQTPTTLYPASTENHSATSPRQATSSTIKASLSAAAAESNNAVPSTLNSDQPSIIGGAVTYAADNKFSIMSVALLLFMALVSLYYLVKYWREYKSKSDVSVEDVDYAVKDKFGGKGLDGF